MEKYFTIRNGRANLASTKNFSTCPIGTVLSFAGQTAPRGFLLCDGDSYKVSEYPDLYAVIGNAYGGDTENFNVPNLVDKFIQGSTTSGTEKEAGLPNIEGKWLASSVYTPYFEGTLTGAFSRGEDSQVQSVRRWGSNDGNGANVFSFDASLSNPIYSNSDTVQPPALTMVYIIKAFHTNEGVDSGVSDDVVEYVEGEIAEVESKVDGLISDTSSTTSTYSSAKIDEKYGAYTFGTANATQWLKLTLGNYSKFQPIVISDQYGGKVEIIGMADDGTYKPVKLVRYSYGDWTTYSATDYTTTDQGDANYKIRHLYYYPAGSCYYLEIRQYCTIKVSGTISKPEMVTSLPAATSAMTLIPESNWGRIDDTSTGSTTSTWSSSKIKSEINPTIDISKVFSNGALNIATLCSTYGNGRYVIVGQGTAGNGSATIDIWTLASKAISYIVNVTYSNKTSNTFIGLTYENPTINFETSYLSACNHIAKVCALA